MPILNVYYETDSLATSQTWDSYPSMSYDFLSPDIVINHLKCTSYMRNYIKMLTIFSIIFFNGSFGRVEQFQMDNLTKPNADLKTNVIAIFIYLLFVSIFYFLFIYL